MWYVTNQKNGISALGLQRALGLGSYKTAWAILHKLRRAMVRPGRDRLTGVVEVDETYWGGEEPGVTGRGAEDKALIIVAAQEDGKGIGRIRLRRIPDLTRASPAPLCVKLRTCSNTSITYFSKSPEFGLVTWAQQLSGLAVVFYRLVRGSGLNGEEVSL